MGIGDVWDGLNVWVRVGLLASVCLVVIALVALCAAEFPQEAFGFLGAWLLLYRLPIRGRWRPYIEAVTSVLCGVPLAFVAPVFAWPTDVSMPLLGFIGAVLTSCSFPARAMVASICIGTALGALLWNLGVCAVALGAHGWVLAGCAASFFVVFVFTPLGPIGLERFLFPVLGALLFVEGMAPLVGTLSPGQLFQASSCPAGELAKAGQVTGAAWLLLAMCALPFQHFLLRDDAAENGDGDRRQGLVEGLLPNSQGPLMEKSRRGNGDTSGEGDPEQGGMPDKEEGLSRLPVLCRAIFADESADLSYLTDHEKKLVEICRKDEFERNRILWGGGLL